MRKLVIFVALVLVGLSGVANFVNCHSSAKQRIEKTEVFDKQECESVPGFGQLLRDEIKSYAPIVAKIAKLVLQGQEKGTTYEELALFVDSFGPRPSGSVSLENSINYMLRKFNESQLDNVHGESAMIPRWERGVEWAAIVEPVLHKMEIVALGTSVGTNKTVEGEVALVTSFEELDVLGKAGKLRGKIVVYNVKFTTYGETVKFRTSGASRAAPYGALAALVRSITPFSIYSPHTGVTDYDSNVVRIPTAAITLEDADLIARWTARGKQVKLQLYMEAQNFPNVESRNVIGEIVGSQLPEEVVLISGHIDSWDITQGAMDDGGGMMISYKALDILRKLNLKTRRTLRAVLWTSEEFGLYGVRQYFENRKQDGSLKNFKAVLESDLGTFTPIGLSMAPNNQMLSKCIVAEVVGLLKDWQLNSFDLNYEGSDIGVFSDVGVPGLSLANENSKYFYYHHTRGDSMTVENPDDLDKAVLLWAAASYVLADLSVGLPRA